MAVDGDSSRRLDLVLLWHMHQPDYRDDATGEFRLPWVYLHAIKDYTDMAWHLEHHSGMRAVVNFTPVLLDQLEDYADQFATGSMRDPLLALLNRAGEEPISPAERSLILDRCFHANHERLIAPFASYRALHEIFARVDAEGRDAYVYLSDAYLHDLLTWYHLCWTGETVRRESEVVTRLMIKGSEFTRADRGELFALIGTLIRDVVPRWSRLARSDRVELSTTPQHHPLAPLLLSFASAREALPDAALPHAPAYPGGRERVAAQLETALHEHERRFGSRPFGVWPAEGAVSSELLALVEQHGVLWAASGGQVLRQSLQQGSDVLEEPLPWLYRPYRLAAGAPKLACFFRDDVLSDRIGFDYAKWNSDDAATNLVGELEAIAAAIPDGEAPLVTVALDGENCWEYYPYNGYYFLTALYGALETHAHVRPTTYRDWLAGRIESYPPARAPAAFGELERLVAGSWVGGHFATWIGSPEKNRAWDLLCAAKTSYDGVIAAGRLSREQLRRATALLAACEASDWFWWMSDTNPAHAVAEFDRLFREKLAHLYAALDLAAPPELALPICHGGGQIEAGGTMRRAMP
jgi:alpha-amylase/alpha-mannosidase (GH57 family)